MKTRFALLITMALLAVGLPLPAHAATPFTYTVSGGNATITGYNGTPPANLVIPDEITGDGAYPVTAIGSYAFANKQLTALTLPNSVTSIANSAFQRNQLTELTLPDALTALGNFAFAYNQLTGLTVPDALATINYAAFFSNPLATVRFTGVAPALGAGALGEDTPTVRFPWKHGEPRTTGGYTTPSWKGYPTIPVADVSFVGGGTIAPQLVDVDGTATATKPTDPTKAGHVFTGWLADGAATPFSFATPIEGDTVLTATFSALPAEPVVPDNPAVRTIAGLAPVIVGDAREGKTLVAETGPLSPSDTALTYQWRGDGTVIKGATKATLKLGKAQAGRRITVAITATASGAPSVAKTSGKTTIVASSKPRLVLSTAKVAKNEPVTVTVTGFKSRQKITIWLGKKRYAGRADSRGILTKTVTFAKDTKPGRTRVRVVGQQAGRDRTIQTTIRYR